MSLPESLTKITLSPGERIIVLTFLVIDNKIDVLLEPYLRGYEITGIRDNFDSLGRTAIVGREANSSGR